MLGAALVMAALVAGCSSSGSSPTVLPPVSTTPVATSSSAPAQEPKAAAVAVVRAYFRAKNQLATDTHANALAELIAPSCACTELVQSARDLESQGKHYFGMATLTQVFPTASGKSSVEVFARYDSSPGGTKTRDGRTIFRGTAHHDVKQLFTVRLVRDRWLVAKIILLSAGT